MPPVEHVSLDELVPGVQDDLLPRERRAMVPQRRRVLELVPETERRSTLVELAEAEVSKTPLGREPRFDDLWHRASEMLLSYRDEKFVSAEYARELTTARAQAIDVDRVSDDPPERIAAWMATVTDAEVRRFDLQLLLDLLRIEEDLDKWRDVLEPAAAHVDDLVLLGDFESAMPLAQAIAAHAGGEGRPDRRPFAAAAVDKLAAGQLMLSMVGHLRTVDDDVADLAKMLCHALGGGIIRPLAEALATEERGRAFRRLTDILVSFGSRGQDAVEQLKSSPNPAVRRTAIHLLREFGGNAALPELALGMRLVKSAEHAAMLVRKVSMAAMRDTEKVVRICRFPWSREETRRECQTRGCDGAPSRSSF